jgi:amiloride-sensitive sodium channel
MASFVCEKSMGKELSHSPLLNDDFDITKFLDYEIIYSKLFYDWCNIETNYFYSITLTEDGLCMTFNPVRATSIFRNDTVDPAFIKQYESKKFGVDPKNWDMENGYTLKKLKNHPLRSLDKGKENGFRYYLKVLETYLDNIDKACRKDPQSMKIAVHHPAEVASNKNSFITVPFNKSFTFLLRPSVTKTSESLKSYDPAV